jgi:aldehyde:ferredoxin oxidoreductase
MVGGYTGKILKVDVSDARVERVPVDLETARLFIGGRGLMNKLLWDLVEPGTGAFDPANPLMVFGGPITGMPSSANVVIRCKSPLTASKRGKNLIGHAVSGGQWGAELKLAGWDGVIVTGRAEKPVYLSIDDEDVTVSDASHLWGTTCWQTEVRVKKETDPLARVLSIGPAGEKLVRYASIEQEFFRSIARCGGGAVMGSKNLKAIVVRGTGDMPIVDQETTFSIMRDRWVQPFQNPAAFYSRRRWGTSCGTIGASDRSTGPLKNFKETFWGDEAELAGGLQWESRSRIKNRSCFGCPATCMQLGVTRTGPYAGTIDSPDYDSTELIGPNCMVTDTDGMYAISSYMDEMGVDSISAGVVLGWAMECYEKGVLSKEELDGIDLAWGNVPAMLEMTEKIVRREGVGDLLAEGVKIASEKVGRGTDKFAIHAKGVEFGSGGIANNRNVAQCYNCGMSPYGGVHHYGTSIDAQNVQCMCDSLTICTFIGRGLGWAPLSKLLNAVTGEDMITSFEEWNRIANRILILERAWNIREGSIPDEDDVLPDRFHEDPLTLGPKGGTPAAIYPRDQYEKDRQMWYSERGCDAHGIPTKETLKTLNLDFVIPTFEKLNLV